MVTGIFVKLFYEDAECEAPLKKEKPTAIIQRRKPPWQIRSTCPTCREISFHPNLRSFDCWVEEGIAFRFA